MKKHFSIPDTMQAAEIDSGRLVAAHRPVPVPGIGEVLVRVAAAGVNRPDILQRRGLYAPPAGVTDIPGLEIAGEIVARGPKAGRLKTGQAVVALVSGGGYAEYCLAPAAQCLPVPKNMGLIAAAGLPETVFTVWFNLFEQAQVKPGERALVHGGASGIGTTAIQMLRAFGAEAIVTCGSDEKVAACLKLGAAQAINYKTADFVKAVEDLGGVDVVLDMVGGDYVARNLSCLKRHGRHVSIAVQAGRAATIDIFQVMSKQLILTGSTLRPQPAQVKADLARAVKKNVWPLIDKNKIGPVVDRVFPLVQAQAAHDYLDSGQHFGKVILKVS
jgi:putative PIG3 family NAD(P)H quinone oxidoreductase